jgi:hypothetical protein
VAKAIKMILFDYSIISTLWAVIAGRSSLKCHHTPGKTYLHLFKFERYMGDKVLMRVRDDIP